MGFDLTDVEQGVWSYLRPNLSRRLRKLLENPRACPVDFVLPLQALSCPDSFLPVVSLLNLNIITKSK